MSEIPRLERHCGSWIIVDPSSGCAVRETFIKSTALTFARLGYEVVTAAQWLSRLNRMLGHVR